MEAIKENQREDELNQSRDSGLDRTCNFMGNHSIDFNDDQSAAGLQISLSQDDPVKTTLATKAIDELFLLTISFCNVVEMFF